MLTPNSYVGEADGWSMKNVNLPDSISHGDKLLMIPFEEWGKGIYAGLIILFHVAYKEDGEGCLLKEYTGKALKAKNPKFKSIDLCDGLEFVKSLAVCAAILPKYLV